MRTTATAALLLAALTACGTNTPTGPGQPRPDQTVTAATETTAGSETGDKALGLTDTATYTDGTRVQLADFARGASGELAAPADSPYIKFTLKVVNGGKKTLDLAGLYVVCQYGDEGIEGEQVFDADNGLNGSPSTHLRPGRSSTSTLACKVPKEESYLQVEVTHGLDAAAIFAGEVK